MTPTPTRFRSLALALCVALTACADDGASGSSDVADVADDAVSHAADGTPDTDDADLSDTGFDEDVADDGVSDAPDGVADTADRGLDDGGADSFPPPPDCGEYMLITREASHDDVAFRLDRCMPLICAGGCPVFTPQLSIRTGTRIDVATDDDIEYQMTHHNWQDSLVGTLSDRRLLWRVEFDFEDAVVEQHDLAIETLDGTPILAETRFTIDPF